VIEGSFWRRTPRLKAVGASQGCRFACFAVILLVGSTIKSDDIKLFTTSEVRFFESAS